MEGQRYGQVDQLLLFTCQAVQRNNKKQQVGSTRTSDRLTLESLETALDPASRPVGQQAQHLSTSAPQQRPTASHSLTRTNGKWRNAKWRNAKWRNAKWQMANGKWQIPYPYELFFPTYP
jgi:hypothetical protein